MYICLCSDVVIGFVILDFLVLCFFLLFLCCYLFVGVLRWDLEMIGSLIRLFVGVNMVVKVEDFDIYRFISIGKLIGYFNFLSVYFWVWFGGL